jgi:hypothetical protein
MTKDEAMQQALEALENHEGNYKLGRAGCERQEAVITAIKEVLAQQPRPEQQQARVDVITVTLMREGINKHRARELADHFVNFTLTPPLPEQRKPLTDEEIDALANNNGTVDLVTWWRQLARAIEAAHGITVPKAEPVGKVVEVNNDGFRCEFSQRLAVGTKLYIAPPLPVQEPVAWDKPSASFDEWWDGDRRRDTANPFDTDSFAYWAWEGWQAALAQRPWQGLEAEDLAQIESDEFWQVGNHMAIAMAVEAALRSKNHD